MSIPAYDDNGNRLTQTDLSGPITHTWDARNRLTGVSGPSLTASFAYDGLGRRATVLLGDAVLGDAGNWCNWLKSVP